jgi:hypothetical protein
MLKQISLFLVFTVAYSVSLPAQTPAPVVTTAPAAPEETAVSSAQEGDLAFGRYYFTGGTIISKRDDFQGADIYAAFNFDKSWLFDGSTSIATSTLA